MKSVQMTVQGMARVILVLARATVVRAMIAPRHGPAKTAAHRLARILATTMASACQGRVTVMKDSLVRRAMSASAQMTAQATACAQ